MTNPRTVILVLAAAVALGVATAPAANAQPAPSAADIAVAKKAFGEGKALFDAKKYGAAIEKFKESYRLSKNPLLLYNIAVSLGANNQEDMALFYYRKFLTDAPKDAAQRPDAEAAAAALEARLGAGAGKTETGGGGGGVDDAGTPEPVKVPPPKIKRAGTYTAADFKHRVVEEAPPGKPLDLTAVVPADSGFAVTMFFRGAGEAQFTAVPMKWRYNELVARMPPKKMTGTSVQYYLEVRDPAGGLVTKIAKAASPNVVYLDPKSSAQFYPDWNPDAASTSYTGDTAPEVMTTGGGGGSGGSRPIDDEDPLRADTSDDPLAGGRPNGGRVADSSTIPGDGSGAFRTEFPTGGAGFMDVGSSKFRYTKWGTTIVGASMLGASVAFYFRATNAAATLEGEANAGSCQDGQPPPCEFDDFLRDAEALGKSSQTLHKVTLGVGVVVSGVALYYWAKELRGGGLRESSTRTGHRNKKKKLLFAAPTIGDGAIGGAAAWEW